MPKTTVLPYIDTVPGFAPVDASLIGRVFPERSHGLVKRLYLRSGNDLAPNGDLLADELGQLLSGDSHYSRAFRALAWGRLAVQVADMQQARQYAQNAYWQDLVDRAEALCSTSFSPKLSAEAPEEVDAEAQTEKSDHESDKLVLLAYLDHVFKALVELSAELNEKLDAAVDEVVTGVEELLSQDEAVRGAFDAPIERPALREAVVGAYEDTTAAYMVGPEAIMTPRPSAAHATRPALPVARERNEVATVEDFAARTAENFIARLRPRSSAPVNVLARVRDVFSEQARDLFGATMRFADTVCILNMLQTTLRVLNAPMPGSYRETGPVTPPTSTVNTEAAMSGLSLTR